MRSPAIRVIFFGLCAIMLISTLSMKVEGQSSFQAYSMNLTVYRDGLVHVSQEMVVDETVPQITLPLLSSAIENVLLLDENRTVVDYKIEASNLTAYTLGAKKVILEYDTNTLTRKEAEVWTLTINHSHNITAFFPQNSSIIYLSQMPTAIETQENTMTLYLSSGPWEISYILPVAAPNQPTIKPDNTEAASNSFPIEYVAIAALAIGVAVFSAFMFFKKRKGFNVEKILKANPQLAKEDRDVLQFLAEKEGKAFEAELREKFPDMPRTSLWRLVRRLERLEIVEVKKIGLENQVQLKK